MLTIILFLIGYFPNLQHTEQEEIVNITVHSDYPESFIFYRYVHQILRNQRVSQSKLDCVTLELQETGLFEEVVISSLQRSDGMVDITVRAKQRSGAEQVLMEEVLIEGFDELDKTEILLKLTHRDIKAGISIKKFTHSEIYELVKKVFEKAINKNRKIKRKYENTVIWVGIKQSSTNTAKLIISPSYKGNCQNDSNTANTN